jgi:hypothetical protein
MRLAMLLGALGLAVLLPVADAAANQRPQDRATAQQPRAAAPEAGGAAAPAARQAAQPQRQAAQPQRPAQRQATAAQAAAQRQAQAAAQRPADARQQPAQAAAQRSGVFRTAAAAPAGVPRATGTCTRRDAQGRCVGTTATNTRWQGGLPPMTMAQQECPSGTVATLARGHANVVRCLPI